MRTGATVTCKAGYSETQREQADSKGFFHLDISEAEVGPLTTLVRAPNNSIAGKQPTRLAGPIWEWPASKRAQIDVRLSRAYAR